MIPILLCLIGMSGLVLAAGMELGYRIARRSIEWSMADIPLQLTAEDEFEVQEWTKAN